MSEEVPEQPRKFRIPWKKFRSLGLFLLGMAGAFAGLVVYNAFFSGPKPPTDQAFRSTVVSIMASATPAPAYSAQVYQVIRPSLVWIEADGKSNATDKETSLGSGTIIDDKGDILTSLHVVSGAKSIKVTFADGTESAAVVATQQPELDIAVLQPETPPSVIVPAVLGNPGAMNIGDEAYAVGNPFGLYASMSSGVISGFDRTFNPEREGGQTLKGLIQIDTAVNPGNSGGPLLNRYGEVIGVVTGIINPTGQEVFIGIGFAVPINVAAGAAGSPPY